MHDVMIGPLVADMFPRGIESDAHFLMDSNNPEDMLPSNLLQNKQYIPNVILEKDFMSKKEIGESNSRGKRCS